MLTKETVRRNNEFQTKKIGYISVVVAIISIFPYLYYGLNTLTKIRNC
jgi:hypothetical protein